MGPVVWLVTGVSSGFGEHFVHAILARNDKLIATSRHPSKLQSRFPSSPNLILLKVDPNSPEAAIQSAAAEAISAFGHVDVVVNNAGFHKQGVLEEMSQADLHSQLEPNLFGALKVTQAFLPHLRSRGQTGYSTVVFIGSASGWNAFPYSGAYSVSKYGLEAVAEALGKEIAPFGVRTLMVNPGFFESELLSTNLEEYPAVKLPEYQPIRDAVAGFMVQMAKTPGLGGDMSKAVNLVIDVVKGEGVAEGRPWPGRLVLGKDAVASIREKCEITLRGLQEWEEVSTSTGGSFMNPEGI